MESHWTRGGEQLVLKHKYRFLRGRKNFEVIKEEARRKGEVRNAAIHSGE